LESSECQQQYSGEKNVIFRQFGQALCQPKNGTAIKTSSTSGAYYGQLDLLAQKMIDL
jgi:hypothetical protein